MTYAPILDGRAKKLSLLFIVTGFVLMIFAAFLPYRAIYQAVALATVAGGIFLLVRHVLTEFRYIINDSEDGSSDFIIFKKQGRNDIKVCHISLFNVEDIYKYGDKKVKSGSRYAYNQNMTDEKYVLLTRDSEKLVEIIIEPNAFFLEEIKKRVGCGTDSNNNLIM